MYTLNSLFLIVLTLSVSACGERSAIFVTGTSVGINAESAPPNLSFAYDRQEGFFGPADQDGNTPPVVARIQSNQSVFSPEVTQLYATGKAALDVTASSASIEDRRREIAENQSAAISGDRRVAFFGVTQTTGLKVTFNPTNIIDSVALGYKRKEASYLPLVEDPDTGEAQYPSTLAALTLNTRIEGLTNTDLGIGQFFATGDAARNLASSDEIRGLFKSAAKSSVQNARGPIQVTTRDMKSDCITNWVRNGNEEQTRGWLLANDLSLGELNNERPQADRERFIEQNNLTC